MVGCCVEWWWHVGLYCQPQSLSSGLLILDLDFGPEFGTWIWDLGLTKISLTYEVSKVIGVAGWVPPAQFQFPKDFGWTYNLGVGLGVDNY